MWTAIFKGCLLTHCLKSYPPSPTGRESAWQSTWHKRDPWDWSSLKADANWGSNEYSNSVPKHLPLHPKLRETLEAETWTKLSQESSPSTHVHCLTLIFPQSKWLLSLFIIPYWYKCFCWLRKVSLTQRNTNIWTSTVDRKPSAKYIWPTINCSQQVTSTGLLQHGIYK